MKPNQIRSLRTVSRLAGALLAAAGLLAGIAGFDAPVKAESPKSLQVTSVAGPPQLAAGATGAYVVAVHNPNEEFDDGMQVLISTGGALRPTGTIIRDTSIGCTAEPATATTTGGYRCIAASLKGGAITTLTASVQAVGAGQGRVEAVAWGLTDTGGDAEQRLIVAVTSPNAVVRLGASGEAVRTIQFLLSHHGVDVEIDGDFGPQTEQAVRDFQRAKGVAVDGVVGPQTWAALFVTVRPGDESDAVRAAQSQLASQGVEVEVDGDFGTQTEQAVRDFQRARGLAVDGVVGPQTWAALVAAD